jgi:hypothetical protein
MKKYFRKLFTGWGVYDLSEWVIVDDKAGNLYHREMMFLLLIYRYAHGGTLYDLYLLGWGDEALISRAFNKAADILFQRWHNHTANSLAHAVPLFPEFNRIFKQRLRSQTRNPVPPDRPLPADAEHLAGIMDGTRRRSGPSG